MARRPISSLGCRIVVSGGWQVEAYRGGRLIAFDSADALGRYSIDAPIAYGENPVEFVAYGPFGEVRRFSRTHRVDGTRIPARQLEYGVSVGACRTDRCDATANADLRYGLSTRWTARAGVDQFWRGDSLPSLFHPYAGIAGMLGNSVGVEAEVVRLDRRIAHYARLDLEPAARQRAIRVGGV